MGRAAGPARSVGTDVGEAGAGKSSVWPRVGTALVFTASGAVQSSWFSRLPAVKDRVGADFSGIGGALLALGAGTFVMIALAGVLCRRFGSRRVVASAAVTGCSMLAVLGAVRSSAQLAAALLGFGLALGAWDGAMNIEATRLERQSGQHWLTRLHGWWSVGSVGGAGLGAAAAWAGLSMTAHLGVAAAAGAVMCLSGVRAFAPSGSARLSAVRTRVDRRWLSRIGVASLLILVGATIEGAAGDWLAIFLTSSRRLTHASAAAAYTIFVVAVAGGRFLAVPLYRAIGKVATVRCGAVLAGVGVGAVVGAPAAGAALLGAFCWGLGICVVFPAVVSASGRTGSGHVVAGVTAVGYGAAVVGPLAIGSLADAAGLGGALLVLPVLTLVLIAFAPFLEHRYDGPAARR
jgi:hypothetical protein